MAIKALTPGKTFSYTSVTDKRPPLIPATEGNADPDNSEHDNYVPTRWGMRVLDSRVLGVLKDKSTKLTIDPQRPDEEVGTQIGQNNYYFEVCQLGLTEETTGFVDDSGKVIPFVGARRNIGGKGYPIASAEYVGRIPDYIVAELAERIIAGNSLSDDEGNVSA